MMDPMIDELCGAVEAAPLLRHLEAFALRVKLSGSREEFESFEYLRAQLDGYGFRTDMILHDAYISLPGAARVELTGETPDCITHSFSRASPKDGLRGRVVYAGAGTPADFASIDASGKIVLLEGIATPAASVAASQAGAIGQIHISPSEHLYEMCISPVWGSPTPDQLDLLPTTVVLSLRKPDGDALKARVLGGETVDALLYAKVDTGWRKTPILEANLEADAAIDDSFILFSGHHDTWHYGVMDNGSGNAVMLEVARLFAPKRGALKRHLRLCFWSGHSHGRYSGSSWYADDRFRDLMQNCVAHVNVDSVGAKGATVLSGTPSSNELFALGAEAVLQQAGQAVEGRRMNRAGDQSFWGIGIPSLFMGMGEQPAAHEPGDVAGVQKAGGYGWWWHTPDDTLDKMDAELLVRDTRIYVHAIARLLTDEILPLDVARQAEALGRELSLLCANLGDRLDLSTVAADTAALALTARRLTKNARILDAPLVNRALMAATRALVPMDYTTGNRFHPDPSLKQGTYPVLDPIRALAMTKVDTDEARFAGVAAKRALNLLACAIEEARAQLHLSADQ